MKNLKQLKEIEKNYAFQLGFDNYLEEVEIIIEFNYYDSKTGEAVFVEQLESYINNNS